MYAHASWSLLSPRRWCIGLSRLNRRLQQRKIPRYVQIDLGEKVTERQDRPGWLTPLLGPAPQSLEDLRTALRAVARDPLPEGLVLRIDSTDLSLSKAQSIIELLTEFRQLDRSWHGPVGATPKRIVCFLHVCTTASYLVATAADQIILAPVSAWNLMGLSQRSLYLHRLLDRIGLDFEVIRAGRWKNAANMLTAEYMAAHERSHLLTVLQSLHDQIVTQIAQGRDLSRARVQTALDRGPLLAQEALQYQLVDEVCAWSQVPARLAGTSTPQAMVLKPYAAIRGLLWPEYRRRYSKAIAVITVQGIINLGSSGTRPGDSTVGHRDLLAAIQAARDSKKRLAGVILHVDSPGGSALASHIVHDALLQLRADLPLVIYMGRVAASGGYYLATAGQHIMAQAATLTGSIGVFLAQPLTHRLQSKLGIQTAQLRLGANAGIFDPATPLSTAQRALLQRHVDDSYDNFKQVVQAGRGLDGSHLEELAEGRVWTGQQALERNLVDALGSFGQAVAYIRTQAGIPADCKIRIRNLTVPSRLSALYRAMPSSRLESWHWLRRSQYFLETAIRRPQDALWMLADDLLDWPL